MTTIIDRRQNPTDRSIGSRQKFLKRAKEQIKKAVNDAIANTDVKNFGKGSVKVPIRGISEPTFNNDPTTGRRKAVIPGNKDFAEGDLVDKPEGGMGRGGKASDSGDGEDEFEFALTKDEFLDFFFDDLELPNLVEKELKDLVKTSPKRSGYTTTGNPANLSVQATMKKSIGRRIALKRPKQSDIDALLAEDPIDEIALEKLTNRKRGIPYLDKMDLRYRNYVDMPMPNSRAVMICLMDVSGSMQEREKDLAKRFYILLYLLLHKKYKDVEIIFVRHHHTAEECNEHDFFHKKESGGTIVSEGLKLVNEVIMRYPTSDWNIYMAQASDGDTYSGDGENCIKELNIMLPNLQHMVYIDILNMYSNNEPSELWNLYYQVHATTTKLSMAELYEASDIWPAFSEIYSKD